MLNTIKTPTKSTTMQVFGRATPQVAAVEQALLGALILEKGSLNDVIDTISPFSFYQERHKIIYKAIKHLFDKNKGCVDLNTVIVELRGRGELEAIGGISYLAEITHNIVSSSHVEHHALLLLEYQMRRELIKVSAKAYEDAFDEKNDIFELINDSESSLFGVTDKVVKRGAGSQSLTQLMASKIEQSQNFKGDFLGTSTGFYDLDYFLEGLRDGHLAVLCARPAMGKTTLGVQIARNIAVNEGRAVGIISLEMSGGELAMRLMSSEAEISALKIEKNKLSESEWQHFYKKTSNLAEANVQIQETSGMSLFDIKAVARRWKAKEDIGLLLVDYLQLVNFQETNRYLTREQEVAKISKGLKEIAKELNIPVLCICQLNRALETRGGDKRPTLSDIRDSGSVEQDADIVLGLYRPEYYGITEDENNEPTDGVAEVLILKNRGGKTGKIKLNFRSDITKFYDKQR